MDKSAAGGTRNFRQNVIVMRHGDRMDVFEPLWHVTADKPWDPPLIDAGKVRAFCAGRKIRAKSDFLISRVFVSPFLRCVQTAAEVVTALCAKEEDPTAISSDGVDVDPSKVKVAIEPGLCEVLNSITIRVESVPTSGQWGFKIPELEALFPAGTVDRSTKPVYNEMPKWEEDQACARKRYAEVIKALADKYPTENLLLVTHGEAVGVAVSAFLKDALTEVYEVDYCAHAHLTRYITYNKGQPCIAENLECLGRPGENGVSYTICTPNT
uniref:Phosphoglycerate mutase family protein n=1 Tax=Kalanchoe fedtschenkoi TaxID=63787 RepID=A0A7N1A0W6_KALFE